MKLQFNLFLAAMPFYLNRDGYGCGCADAAQHPKVIMSDDPVHDTYIVVYKDTGNKDTASSSSSNIHPTSSIQVKKKVEELTTFTNVKVTSIFEMALHGFAAKMTLEEAEAMADSDDNIAYIEQDTKIRVPSAVMVHTNTTASTSASTSTTITSLSSSISSSSAAQKVEWGLDRIDQKQKPLTKSYLPPSNGKGVTAYVMDSGIRITHEEFENRASWGINLAGDGIDDDCDGHGTHVAGIIAGKKYGVANEAKVVAIKVYDCVGDGSSAKAIQGIEWIMQNHDMSKPATVNMSFVVKPVNTALNDAANNLHNSGIPTVVAAGNENVNACKRSPASATDVITVGATTKADARWEHSNWGKCVNIMAPGAKIRSAAHYSDTSTKKRSGTSMATPHVCGAVAQLLEMGVRPADVRSELITKMATEDVLTNLKKGTPNKLLNVHKCSQSIALFDFKGKRRDCGWVNARKGRICKRKDIQRYCPSTCGACDKWGCADAGDESIPFYTSTKATFAWTCQKVQSLTEERRKKLCKNHKFYTTCRITCDEQCDRKSLLLNFDDVDDDSGHYYHPLIQLTCYRYLDGKKYYPNEGFGFGVISKPMIAYNCASGAPMTMSCPGGSFDLLSMYMTAGWREMPALLEGYRDGTVNATFSLTLSPDLQPKYFESEFSSFTNLDSLVISTGTGTRGDQIVLDDVEIQINSNCTVTNPN